jgi:hypothetical protein
LGSRRKIPFSTLFFRQEYVTFQRSDKAMYGRLAAIVKFSLRFQCGVNARADRAPAALRRALRYR